MSGYRPSEIEPKWQRRWEDAGIYHATIDGSETARNYYNLTMFPYPSGDLHAGHLYAYTGPDIHARYKRAQGHNVYFPFGYDAFGLPAENAAIKRNIHPKTWTDQNIQYMTGQIQRLGTSIDWRGTLATHLPEYYYWNQRFFLQFFERGLAYREFAPVDWCPGCNTTLAREQVKGENRVCERCDTPVIRRELNQWKFRITAYAERLLNDLEKLAWPENIKAMQRNWIGKTVGAEIHFAIDGIAEPITVFTTRPDTIYGATFLVLAPEHRLVSDLTTLEFTDVISAYQYNALRQSEVERLSTEREKTGVFTGSFAIHSLTGERIPIWIGDYVLASYGTGAVMGVPGADERDFEFAVRYKLPVVPVVEPVGASSLHQSEENRIDFYADPGRMINSGSMTGLLSAGAFASSEWGSAQTEAYGFNPFTDGTEAKQAALQLLEEKRAGQATVTYRLRDWLVSRQRYWGTPIPIVYCDRCGIQGVPAEDLPVLLPMDVDFRPTGESPLKFHAGFRNTACPICGGPAERETDTMDTFVDSSWYFYRYLDPHNPSAPFRADRAQAWMPAHQYMGGAEHAVMHLLYSRFWTKVMFDMGLIANDEPFLRLYNQGMILGPDMQKMSKSRGNVVGSDKLLAEHGADVVRGYLMFIGPWDQGGPFQLTGIEGIRRFYRRVWQIATHDERSDVVPNYEDPDLERILHGMIERVGTAYDNFDFHLAIAALMEFSSELRSRQLDGTVHPKLMAEAINVFLILLAPIAPHLTEELWEKRGQEFSIHKEPWPQYDATKARPNTVELVVQVNGKLRDRLRLAPETPETTVLEMALKSSRVSNALGGRAPQKVIFVPGKLINLVG